MEGKNKPVDLQFEREKKDLEWKNKQDVHEGLASKFSELIAENPIVIYTQHNGFKPEKMGIFFDKIKEIRTDESGTGGSISVAFNYDDWIAVRTSGFSSSNYFDKTSDYYKITKESLSNIMRMMNELIERSGYTEQEKDAMSKSVFENFRNKIVKQEDIGKN